MKKAGYAYVMASKGKVLYTGVTSNLAARVYQCKRSIILIDLQRNIIVPIHFTQVEVMNGND